MYLPGFSGASSGFLEGIELEIEAKKAGDLEGFKVDSVSERRFKGGKGFGGFLNQFSPNGPKFTDAIDGREGQALDFGSSEFAITV